MQVGRGEKAGRRAGALHDFLASWPHLAAGARCCVLRSSTLHALALASARPCMEPLAEGSLSQISESAVLRPALLWCAPQCSATRPTSTAAWRR